MLDLKRRIRDMIFLLRQTAQLERSMVLSGQVSARQILAKGKLKKLSDAGFGVYSQTDEDGILSWLIDILELNNETFIEFGVHDYRESNTRYIAEIRNWSGLVIDGDPKNIQSMKRDTLSMSRDLRLVASFVTRDNINSLIHSSGLGSNVGILSVDIDGVDYWILEAMEVNADIVVVEYNDFLGDAPVSVPYSESFSRYDACAHGIYWGASLSAFTHLLNSRGYEFIGTNILGINAFYVKQSHYITLSNWLDKHVAHPCKVREARDSTGSISFLPYSNYTTAAAHLPLISVDTGKQVKLGDTCRR